MFHGLHVASKIPRATEYIFYWGKKAASRFLFLMHGTSSDGRGARWMRCEGWGLRWETAAQYDFYLNLQKGL